VVLLKYQITKGGSKMENTKRIVEVGGVKVEVDLRTAKTVSEYKVGDKIKILCKEYSEYKCYYGTIVGFDQFQTLPTIVVAYIKNSYSEANLCFVYLNSQSKDFEIAPINDWEIDIDIEKIKNQFEYDIEQAKKVIDDKQKKYVWFMDNYNKFFDKKESK